VYKMERQIVETFYIGSGVQGGILSLYLFACFIDSMVDKIKASGRGLWRSHDIFGVSVC